MPTDEIEHFVKISAVKCFFYKETTYDDFNDLSFFKNHAFWKSQAVPQLPGRSERVLLFSKEQPDRYTGEVEIFPQLVFEVVFIRFFNIIGEIAEKRERRYISG